MTVTRACHIPVVGAGGPVGSAGKTARVQAICLRLRDYCSLAVATRDIFTNAFVEF